MQSCILSPRVWSGSRTSLTRYGCRWCEGSCAVHTRKTQHVPSQKNQSFHSFGPLLLLKIRNLTIFAQIYCDGSCSRKCSFHSRTMGDQRSRNMKNHIPHRVFAHHPINHGHGESLSIATKYTRGVHLPLVGEEAQSTGGAVLAVVLLQSLNHESRVGNHREDQCWHPSTQSREPGKKLTRFTFKPTGHVHQWISWSSKDCILAQEDWTT